MYSSQAQRCKSLSLISSRGSKKYPFTPSAIPHVNGTGVVFSEKLTRAFLTSSLAILTRFLP
jgi:hypothetical protein